MVKALFDAIEYESEIEKQFARDLDNNENVRVFVKLPRWFKIDTPIGPYNPDWAFVTERDEKLYFVRETKSTLDSEERRTKENQKILCGRKHFEMLEVDFDFIITAQQIGSYKPDHRNFQKALEVFNIEKQEHLHVAQSIYHDIVPANQLGLNKVWVNRYGEPERTDPIEYPDLEVPDLQSLVRILEIEKA